LCFNKIYALEENIGARSCDAKLPMQILLDLSEGPTMTNLRSIKVLLWPT